KASSRSRRTSAALWYRRLGSLCKQRRNRERTGCGVSPCKRDQSGSAFMMPPRISTVLSPSKGDLPVSISKNTTPKDQISERVVVILPFACSGDMYAAVPRITPALVATALKVGELDSDAVPELLSKALARPKSRTLTLPSGVIFTFAGFKSR